MQEFEYRVIPAPKKGKRAKGVRGGEARFANALVTVMNEMGAEGWEYVRADTLPCEERVGLTGKTTAFHNMLVFRRPKAGTHAVTHAPVPQMRDAEVPPTEDVWAKFAMAHEETPGAEDVDPSVVDLLAERKARSPSPSPAAITPSQAAE